MKTCYINVSPEQVKDSLQNLVAENTIDEDVMRALEHKDTGQEALLAAVKARIEMEGRKL